MFALGARTRYKAITDLFLGKGPRLVGRGCGMEAVYARTEHGSHRVTRNPGSGYRVAWPSGERAYPSARKTIIALVNRNPTPPPSAYDPHLTFDRYFRRGRFRATEEAKPALDVFDLFRPSKTLAVAAPARAQIKTSPALTVFVEPGPKRGFSMEERAIEVRKLFYAGFARRVSRMGYEPEDVLQDVYAGLLVRNTGKCPFDATKSSFGHYVHMVVGCILSNYHRRYARLSRNESFGASVLRDGSREMVDVAEADLVAVAAVQEGEAVLASTLATLTVHVENAAFESGVDPDLAVRCITYLQEGRRNKEISEITDASPSMVSKAIRLVRDVAREWRNESRATA